jgi:hypothetical protein
MKKRKQRKIRDTGPPERIGWDYRPIVRGGPTVPWGYDVDPDDRNILRPNLKMLALLEKAEYAFWHKTSTHTQLAEWLTAKTGVPISRVGLRKRFLDGNKKLSSEQR